MIIKRASGGHKAGLTEVWSIGSWCQPWVHDI